MKNLKRLPFIIVLVLSLAFICPSTLPLYQNIAIVEAASKIKLNTTSTTLQVGESISLKLTGTTKKIKWSSSRESIATVNSKGKVIAKKKGTVNITAKISNKKYTCKIKVINKFKSSSVKKKIAVSKLKSKCTYDGIKLVLYKFKNNSEYFIDLDTEAVFYDDGAICGLDERSMKSVAPGREVVLYYYPDESYDKCKVNFSVSESYYKFNEYNKIKISSTKNKSGDIFSTIKNKSSKTINQTNLLILYYDKDGYIIDFHVPSNDIDYKTITKNKSVIAKFYRPFDDNGKTLKYNKYKVYLNSAISY